MSKLEFLEISRNFRSYYRTLRDVNYFLGNDSELEKDKIKAASQALTKLIYGFIRTNATTFREMNHEQYDKEYHMFHEDFLSIIQNSGENNVDFDSFTALLDEVIGIANQRTNTLRKIKRAKQTNVQEVEENDNQVSPDEVDLSNEDESNDEVQNLNVDVKGISDVVEAAEGGVKVVEDEVTFGDDVVEEVMGVVENLNDDVEYIIEKTGYVNDEVGNLVGGLGNIHDEVEPIRKEGAIVKPDEMNDEDDESADIFHYRPKRRRFR